ncbi:hypothetical protein [Polynucleobacter sp.]|uniref:hypothetical protein n=1 Tax=Polynucleobacter sp. TaxID=2029855 RepID=UPI003F69B616
MGRESSNSSSLDAVDEISTLLDGGDEIEGEVEDVIEDSEEVEAEETEETETEESPEDESEENASWESVLGVKEDQLSFDDNGALKGINVKINGEVSTVKVQDLIAGYQINKALTQKQQVFAEERKAFEAQAQTLAQEYKSKLENAEAITNYLSSKIVAEFQGIDWNKLRVENPAEYAAARQDYAARAQEVQQALEALQAEKSTLTVAEQQQMQQHHAKHLQSQREKMLDNNPAWNDPNVFKQEMTGMKSFLSEKYGFTDQDFAQVNDARLIELVKDAKKYRDGATVAQKKIAVPVPKFQKSVGKSKKPLSKLAELTKKAKLSKGANKRAAQRDAITELLTGGI